MWPPETLILIVDDMPGMRKLVRGAMRDMGFKNFIEAEDGKVAYEHLVRQVEKGDPVGLILSDWNMPVVRGIDLLKKVRSMQDVGNVPFFLITAEQDFVQVKEAIAYKVNDYIVKPFTPAVLRKKLETAYAKLYNKG